MLRIFVQSVLLNTKSIVSAIKSFNYTADSSNQSGTTTIKYSATKKWWHAVHCFFHWDIKPEADHFTIFFKGDLALFTWIGMLVTIFCTNSKYSQSALPKFLHLIVSVGRIMLCSLTQNHFSIVLLVHYFSGVRSNAYTYKLWSTLGIFRDERCYIYKRYY